MVKKTIVFACSISWLIGCAVVELSPSGRAVRTISPAIAHDCNHLGLVSSWKGAIDGGLSAAQVDVRNRVGMIGGNAMVIISQVIDPPPYQHAQIMSEAYFCKFNPL